MVQRNLWQSNWSKAVSYKTIKHSQKQRVERDYENDTNIPHIWNGTDYDFELDPEEHFARINSVGHVLQKYSELSWMNFNFEQKLIAYSEKMGLSLIQIATIASVTF